MASAPSGATLPPGMADVDLEREVEGAVFLVVAFVVLEVDGEGTTTAVRAVSTAAAFLPLAVGLARDFGGAVFKWLLAAAALAFVPA